MGTDESPEDPGVGGGVEGVSAGFPASGGQREGRVERCLSAPPTHRPWLSIPGNHLSASGFHVQSVEAAVRGGRDSHEVALGLIKTCHFVPPWGPALTHTSLVAWCCCVCTSTGSAREEVGCSGPSPGLAQPLGKAGPLGR